MEESNKTIEVTVKNVDMEEAMVEDVKKIAVEAVKRYNIDKDIASYIRREFEKKYNPTWHVIVGRNFSSSVTHEAKHFVYFYVEQVAVLLFKSG
mmetsp:Transcript_38960/g.28814  ORF Transcript_38960/g.28814 Transcript_38960/m.28814 type:complete len:94 (+) Transcript_38960:13-294(+)|eukprot:CAMPEP_0202959022 /NCGR_PEP_ID=MMETSP1396-20130829/3291_1 /ASSEMBLY_ACC=CAM_ASM_000872 /TAXON_ID= /ORGANISM="Pseudokeronopsis sp., Strain Brazil" /LENGTH=93 /DNA_ID=CAMNT_0049677381 /DNA_START=12 /DNA_END=293 /DNA_ORIENTATION=+